MNERSADFFDNLSDGIVGFACVSLILFACLIAILVYRSPGD